MFVESLREAISIDENHSVNSFNRYNFLFWNINKKALFDELADLVEELSIDILILAEFPEEKESVLLQKLNRDNSDFFPPHPGSLCEKIKIYTRFHFDFISPVFEDHRLTIREIKFPVGEPILLAAMHFLDKGNLVTKASRKKAH